MHTGAPSRFGRPALLPTKAAAGGGQEALEDTDSGSYASTVPNTPLAVATPFGSPTQPNTIPPSSAEDAERLSVASGAQLAAHIPHTDTSRCAVSPPSETPLTLEMLHAALEPMRQRINEVAQQVSMSSKPICSLQMLQPHATVEDIDAWVVAAKVELHSQPPRPEYLAVGWVLGHASEEIYENWVRHLPTLRYDVPETDVKLEDLWQFIRGERLEPDLFARSYRSQLEDLRQQENESPKQFFLRWHALYLKVKPNFSLAGANSDDLAHHYFNRLLQKLQRALIERKIRLEYADDVCCEAEAVWSLERQEEARQRERSDKRPYSDDNDDNDEASYPLRCSQCGLKGHDSANCRVGRRRKRR